MKLLKRAVSALCAAALLAGTFAGVTKPVSAAGAVLGYWPEPLEIPNEYYYENETLQPYGSCFQIDELKNWSPDNDPDARYNRSAIPLADRWMGPNVNPLASRDAKVMPLAMANARASQAPSQGGDGDSAYVFNNFQYVDIFNFWGGSSSEGPIAIPSPEIIDAAHRNGVPATGTIFLPWGDSTYGDRFVREMVEQDEDGRFIAADKLVEIAQYYGFDGYIFNAESGTGVAGFKEFLEYLQEIKPDNFTITWYNGSGSLSTGSIQSWMQDGDTRVTDHWWLDMSGNGYVDSTIQAAQQTGVNPWNIHSTWEYWPMSGMSGVKGGNYQARLDENGILKCSLGILAPTCTLTQATSSEDFLNNQDQKLWVGPTYDPSSTYRPTNEFCGFASLVADQTPVIGTDFVTNFTAGNGYRFYENGEVVGKEDGWYNRSLTDVLPTWRWIIESEGQKLDAVIDYADAWYAGTSMKLSGSMDAGKSNHVKLYSAQLEITKDSEFSMTYKTPVAGVQVELGLCFGDTYDAENFKFYPLTTTADGQWNTTTIDLSEDAGKTAIAISLRFTAPDGVEDYAVNVGQMAFTTDRTAPEATSGVTLDEVIYPTDKTMEARVYWEKAENAFMYRIYRVHTDGTREFVGATPSDAFYLGSYEKEAGETACTFEIVSYSENFVKGGTQTFSIAWPEEVEDGFVPVFEEGENLALKQPVISSVTCVADGPVHQLNDGTVLNGSKWCSNSTQGYAVIDLGENKTIQRWVVYHANCPGAGESVDMNTVDFDFQYAPDDGGALLDPDDSASVERVKRLDYTVADAVTGNKQDVTDRNLDEPITARYIKLNVTKSDNSAWKAIRIYEFEVYEKAAINNTPSPYERNVTVKNREGAADTVVVDNVPMQYSSGTYSDKNGVFHEDTGKVRLFTDLTSEEPIAVVKAVQPDESYKQRGVGIATFEGLELNPEGGRLFYDVLDGSGPEVTNSRRASVYYAPETGTPSQAPATVTLSRTTGGVQLRKQYATLTATGLEEGATMKIFASADAQTPILHTLPAVNGVITQTRVPLDPEGGTVYYEIYKEGKPDSERYALEYGDPMELAADLTGLQELIAKCETIRQSDCTSATWTAFAEKLDAARTVAAGTPKAAEAEAARAALNEAYAQLRFKGNHQRLDELCREFEAAYPETDYTVGSFAKFQTALQAAQAAISADDSSNYQLEQLRIDLEAAVRGLVKQSEVSVTRVTVTPETTQVLPGGSVQFTARVEGTGDPSQEVTWSLEGQTSTETALTDGGLLSVGRDEPAGAQLTVYAASVEDSTKTARATVTVVEDVEPTEPTDPSEPTIPGLDEDTNVALDATVVAYNGPEAGSSMNGALGGNSGPEKLFDGAYANADTDKWCVDGDNMWVAFDIGEEKDVARAILYHAGVANEYPPEKINTSDFQLYTLNTAKISVEDLLAKSFAERSTILADNSYWTLVADVSGNTSNITTHDFETENARIFKLNVSKTDTTGWAACVRIYELELYAYQESSVPDVEITVTPSELRVDGNPGQKGQFTAVVTGTDDVAVTWSISGNTSAQTLIENGQLFFGADETAKVMTVTATSHADPTKQASATVYVEDETYSITISSDIAHGTVTADRAEAAEGEQVTLTVTPEAGYVLKPGSLQVNGVPVEGTTFVMPGEDVVITAEFISDETEALLAAAQAAAQAAEDAQEQAEAAQAAAEAAEQAAREAAASAAEDKAAAEAARAAAETAKAKAEAAQAAAEAAREAAEEAASAAQASNLAAAQEAAKAAEAAAQAAGSATEAAQSAQAAAEAAEAAQEAREAAEAAQARAEAAQKAAEEAAGAAGEDRTAAQAAKAKAEEAQRQAEEAAQAAEQAWTAAEESAAAAKEAQLAAAQEAQKAAEAAAQAAVSAAEAAEAAAQAAQAMEKAQAAQAAAEAAAQVAEEAAEKAAEAQKRAEEAAESSAENQEAAQRAAQEAEEAREAAQAARKAAEEAQTAAETSRQAAEAANLEAAEAAAEAAEYARKVAETYGEIVEIKAEMVEFLAEAQKAAEEAEAAQKAAEEAQKKAEEAALASTKYRALLDLATYADRDDYARPQQKLLAAAIQAGQDAIQAAADIPEVEEALAGAKKAIDAIPTRAELEAKELPYTDVKEGAWYYQAVQYAVNQGLFQGTTESTFSPNGTMSRAMAVTVLYRLAGSPEVEGTVDFTDVDAEAYYYRALVWAWEAGIVQGVDAERFAPQSMVTREQLVSLLYRYAQTQNMDVSEKADLGDYADAEQVSAYAREAMAWAIGNGIVEGVDAATLAPKGTATRAQAAAILMRFLENF